MSIMAAQGAVVNNQVPKYVTRARASLMLGITEAELSRIAEESGLGHVERAGNQEETYFTYEELQRICIVANQVQGILS
jgi:branched-subunit amino acid aminotransferase/4-amino-4-deoxychorismate lyase